MVFLLPKFCTVSDKVPARLNIGLMLFFACFISYMLRVNMSINILAMVQPSSNSLDENATIAPQPDYGPRYNWSTGEQSLLLGSYFWGYLLTSLPGGVLAEWLGGRTVVAYSLGISALTTALVPLAADLSFWAVFSLRVFTGILGGVVYPALHNLISKWAPPDERGKFISSLLGGTFGTVVTWPMSGLLVENCGWIYAFYVPAIISIFATIVWCLIVYDSPAEHPRIQLQEREYIEKCLGNTISKKKSIPPFLKLASSPPFLALTLLHFGNMWGLYFLITAAPKFISEVLGFNLAEAGILASLPYLARMFSGFIFGLIGDALRAANLISVTTIRKVFCIFSHIIPGMCLLGLAFVGYHPYLCVAIITASLGFNGASTVTNLQNSQDLAPNFAGSLYGTINFIGTSTGFITPLLVGYFTKESNTIKEWSIIFTIGAVAYIFPAIVFALFGSGKVQKWNQSDDSKEQQQQQQQQQFQRQHKIQDIPQA